LEAISKKRLIEIVTFSEWPRKNLMLLITISLLLAFLAGCNNAELEEVRQMEINHVDISALQDGNYRGDFTYGKYTYAVEVSIRDHKIENWDDYLMRESGLPGPRGNLELIQAAAEVGSEEQFLHLISFIPEKAPVNSQQEFLACCGTVGLGKLVTEGKVEYLKLLRSLASDPRWRTREAVAMALQIYGESHMDELIKQMEEWSEGNSYEKRAAVAALCEPKLLKQKEHVLRVLQILDNITESIKSIQDRKDEGFKALRKGLAYCWSVAIVGSPDEGKKAFEKWLSCSDKDINWIVKENLKKERLKRMDKEWVEHCLTNYPC